MSEQGVVDHHRSLARAAIFRCYAEGIDLHEYQMALEVVGDQMVNEGTHTVRDLYEAVFEYLRLKGTLAQGVR